MCPVLQMVSMVREYVLLLEWIGNVSCLVNGQGIWFVSQVERECVLYTSGCMFHCMDPANLVATNHNNRTAWVFRAGSAQLPAVWQGIGIGRK